MNGYYNLPTSGDLDIQTHASKIVPSLTNPTANRIRARGIVTFQGIFFDGISIAEQRYGGSLTTLNCRVNNNYAAVSYMGRMSLSTTWFENCTLSAIISSDYFYMGLDNVFKNCATGIVANRAIIELRSYASLFMDDVTTFVDASQGTLVMDDTSQVWIGPGGVGTYIQADEQSRVTRSYRDARIWPGKAQPGTYLSLAAGSSAQLKSSDVATMTGSTAYIDLAGTPITHADYVAAGMADSDGKGNSVVG